MKTYQNDHGLFVDPSTTPPTCCGYIVNFGDKGAFAPDGKVPATPDEIATHNRLLAEAEWYGMLTHGRGTLYLSYGNGKATVSDWPGVHTIEAGHVKTSFHNFAGDKGRRDVWFSIGETHWHGVNIGGSQILRVRKVKA